MRLFFHKPTLQGLLIIKNHFAFFSTAQIFMPERIFVYISPGKIYENDSRLHIKISLSYLVL